MGSIKSCLAHERPATMVIPLLRRLSLVPYPGCNLSVLPLKCAITLSHLALQTVDLHERQESWYSHGRHLAYGSLGVRLRGWPRPGGLGTGPVIRCQSAKHMRSECQYPPVSGPPWSTHESMMAKANGTN